MRKGAIRNDWSYSEEKFLIDNAGILSRREICLHLKRSKYSVEQKAKALRQSGIPVSLRCHTSKLATCPSCGCLRGRLGKTGICEACRLRRQLQASEVEIAALLQKLPANVRELYAETEADRKSDFLPMPQPPITKGLSRYHKAKAIEDYELAMERWAAVNTSRLAAAARQRKKRIHDKLKELQNQ